MQINNYTQISNEFIESMHKYSGGEIKIFIAISRKTSDIISYSQLEKLTGMSKNTIKKSIEILKKDGLITQEKTKLGYSYYLNISNFETLKNVSIDIL